jgi:hypothetical protein
LPYAHAHNPHKLDKRLTQALTGMGEAKVTLNREAAAPQGRRAAARQVEAIAPSPAQLAVLRDVACLMRREAHFGSRGKIDLQEIEGCSTNHRLRGGSDLIVENW